MNVNINNYTSIVITETVMQRYSMYDLCSYMACQNTYNYTIYPIWPMAHYICTILDYTIYGGAALLGGAAWPAGRTKQKTRCVARAKSTCS